MESQKQLDQPQAINHIILSENANMQLERQTQHNDTLKILVNSKQANNNDDVIIINSQTFENNKNVLSIDNPQEINIKLNENPVFKIPSDINISHQQAIQKLSIALLESKLNELSIPDKDKQLIFKQFYSYIQKNQPQGNCFQLKIHIYFDSLLLSTLSAYILHFKDTKYQQMNVQTKQIFDKLTKLSLHLVILKIFKKIKLDLFNNQFINSLQKFEKNILIFEQISKFVQNILTTQETLKQFYQSIHKQKHIQFKRPQTNQARDQNEKLQNGQIIEINEIKKIQNNQTQDKQIINKKQNDDNIPPPVIPIVNNVAQRSILDSTMDTSHFNYAQIRQNPDANQISEVQKLTEANSQKKQEQQKPEEIKKIQSAHLLNCQTGQLVQKGNIQKNQVIVTASQTILAQNQAKSTQEVQNQEKITQQNGQAKQIGDDVKTQINIDLGC